MHAFASIPAAHAPVLSLLKRPVGDGDATARAVLTTVAFLSPAASELRSFFLTLIREVLVPHTHIRTGHTHVRLNSPELFVSALHYVELGEGLWIIGWLGRREGRDDEMI